MGVSGQRRVGVVVAVVLLALSAAAAPLHAQHHAALPAGVRRVLFLGDSITYSGQYVGFVEAYFRMGEPDCAVEFVNAGLSSETVSGLSEEGHAGGKFPRPDLHERLDRVLERVKPDLVFACYGMNDGIYLPLDEERFGKFKDGMRWLHGRVTEAGAKIVHVTPPPFDETKGKGPGYAAVLDRYSEWLLEQRAAAGWDVVDIHAPMTRYVAERRKADPRFALAGDGVHPNELGHWLMAQQILTQLGAADVAEFKDAAAMASAAGANGPQILKLVRQREDMMKDAWLTATGHKRPGVRRGLPLDEAKAKAAKIDKQIRDLATRK